MTFHLLSVSTLLILCWFYFLYSTQTLFRLIVAPKYWNLWYSGTKLFSTFLPLDFPSPMFTHLTLYVLSLQRKPCGAKISNIGRLVFPFFLSFLFLCVCDILRVGNIYINMLCTILPRFYFCSLCTSRVLYPIMDATTYQYWALIYPLLLFSLSFGACCIPGGAYFKL